MVSPNESDEQRGTYDKYIRRQSPMTSPERRGENCTEWVL